MESEKKAKKFNFKEYYETHPEFKERMKARANEKVMCECGRVVNRSSLATHRKSTSHTKQCEFMKKTN